MAAAMKSSPFYSRAYGGYTHEQEAFFLPLVKTTANVRIFDPMAGQGFSLSQLAWKGAEVSLSDANPAPLALAAMRDPLFLLQRKKLSEWTMDLINKVDKIRKTRPRKPKGAIEYEEGWILPSVAEDLAEYGRLAGLGLFANPFSVKGSFWTTSPETRFAVGIAVLAARELVCFVTTDNLTWLKPGGLPAEQHAGRALRRALARWAAFAEDASRRVDISAAGTLLLHLTNATIKDTPDDLKVPVVDIVVTSPPYANRLDYTRLWAPELELLSAMSSRTARHVKRELIGTTVVRDRQKDLTDSSILPAKIRDVLEMIKCDPAEDSDTYYYPFFRNYAIDLSLALSNSASTLRAGGTFVVFVRDTVRKDVLFPTGDLVVDVLTRSGLNFTQIASERKVVRSHVGFLRKNSSKGLYGLAQQEWWLAFRKGDA